MTEPKRSLTLADIDAAELKWLELVEASYRRELDAIRAECERWKERFREDEARLRDFEAQSGCYDPDERGADEQS